MIQIRKDIYVNPEDVSAIHDSEFGSDGKKRDNHALIILRNRDHIHVYGMRTEDVAARLVKLPAKINLSNQLACNPLGDHYP